MTATAATRRVRIAAKNVEALDICSFELVAVDGRPLMPFSAGAHIDVHLPDGLVRQYSLCNDPREQNRYLIAVLRDPKSRGGSAGMHGLEQGQAIGISDPKNHFPLVHEAKRSLLVAGGIGITPILCMAERLANTQAAFELHYATRSAVRTAFAQRLENASFSSQVWIYHDDDAGKPDIAGVFATPSADTHVYICGPTGFMEAMLAKARSAGWPESALHREYFAASPIDTSADGSFEVQIASSGKVLRVAADQSVTAALALAGIDVPVSCEQGVCGTCVTRVIDGVPDHRDMYLTPDEQSKGDQFTPCCSRAKSARLVLDL